MRFDRFNRLEQATNIYGVITYYSYTPSGLVEKIERKDGKELLTSMTITYNGNGQPLSYVDQSGKIKKFERDEFGRVVKEFFPDDTAVEYNYDALGKLSEVLDQNQHKIKFNWSKFGLDKRTTAANQLTDYVYDRYGMLSKIDSKAKGRTDRSIKYEYNDLDRLVKVSYANGEVENFIYNSWGKLVSSSRGEKTATFKYDYFGRMIEKNENGIVTAFAYNPWGQRISRITRNGAFLSEEKRAYDKFGRLETIESDGKVVRYKYNAKNQLLEQNVNGVPIVFEYTKYGQLKSKTMADSK